MPLPTSLDLSTQQYSFNGLPFAYLATDSHIDTTQQEYSYQGLAFLAASGPTKLPTSPDLGSLTYISNGVPFAHMTGKNAINSFNLTYILNGVPALAPFHNAGSLMKANIQASSSISATGYVPVYARANIVATASIYNNLQDRAIKSHIVAQSIVSGTMLDAIGSFSCDFSCRLGIDAVFQPDFTTGLGVETQFNIDAGTTLSVRPNNLSPVTDYTSADNVFLPTIINNGSYVQYNSATANGVDPTTTCLYISYLDAGMTNCSLCELEGFAFNIGEAGGKWSITSLCNTLGPCFTEISMYGLKGTIGDPGVVISGNTAGFTYSGTWGNPNLRRPFRWVISGNVPMSQLLGNQNVATPPPEKWATASAAASAIAFLAGTNVQWLVPDVPISNFTLEEGQTAIEALSSLASRAGAKLRWNGNNNWEVVYPDVTKGIFNIPSCDLIVPGGVTIVNHCDIENDFIIAGTIPAQSNQGFKDTASTVPQLIEITKFSNRLTADSAPLVYKLPPNYDKVYAQILVNVGQSTSGANLVDPVSNYMTTDQNEFFEFNPAYPGIEYITVANVGGVLQNQVRVDYRCLPAVEAGNAAIEAGNFVFTLAYTTKPLAAPVQSNELAAMAQNNFRFFKTADIQIQCVFFGALPLPGMLCTCTIGDVKIYVPDCNGGYTTVDMGTISISAIIEDVSFSFPGYLTLNLAKYQRLYFYNYAPINYTA